MKGAEFKLLRETLELSQEQVARLLCLSGKQAVSNIETGIRNPSKLSLTILRVLVRLSKVKSKELQDLMIALSDVSKGSRGKK